MWKTILIILGVVVVLGIILFVINHDFSTPAKKLQSRKLIYNNNVLFESTSPVYTSDGNNIFFGDSTGLYKYNGQTTKISSDPIFGLSRNADLNILVLKSDGKLYVYSPSDGTFTFQSSGVSSTFDTIDGFYLNCDTGSAYYGQNRTKNLGTYDSIILTLV